MEMWLYSATFVGITKFTYTNDTNVSHSQLVHEKLQYVLPRSIRSIFLAVSYRGKSFEIWMRLLTA